MGLLFIDVLFICFLQWEVQEKRTSEDYRHLAMQAARSLSFSFHLSALQMGLLSLAAERKWSTVQMVLGYIISV